MIKKYNHLPTGTPEKVGISPTYIHHLLDHLEHKGTEFHHIMIAVDGQVIFKASNHPYHEDIPHILHSLTKTFTNTAVGLAHGEGLLRLSDKVVDFFKEDKELLPDIINENLAEMTIENLITMRSGQARSISGSEWRPLKTSWIKAFFDEPVAHKPGKKYLYSSANSYMLSAIVQKVTGKTIHDYLKEKILDKIGIREFSWELSPEGINSGGNGITMCIEDVMRIGLLYQQNGMWNGEQLIASEWISRSFGRAEDSIVEDKEVPYNYHWVKYGNLYTASGIFGQNCMIVPKLNMVIGVTAGTKDWQDIPKYVNQYFVEPLLAKKEVETKSDENLLERSQKFTLLENKESVSDRPALSNQEVHYMMTAGNPYNISAISFREVYNNYILFSMTDDRGTHSIEAKWDDWRVGMTSMTGNYLHHQYLPDQELVISSAWWTTPTSLCMEWRYPGTAFCDYVTFEFTSDFQQVTMNRRVNVNKEAIELEPVTGQRKNHKKE